MNFQDLLAPVNGEPGVPNALESWQWLLPQPVKPLLATALGDLFVIRESEAVWFLDIISGKIDSVAQSVSEWERSLRDPEFLDRYFLPAFVLAMRESGTVLAQGECYVPKREPVLGGSWEVANWAPGNWVFHLERQGRVHFAIKDLPDGTKITTWNSTEL